MQRWALTDARCAGQSGRTFSSKNSIIRGEMKYEQSIPSILPVLVLAIQACGAAAVKARYRISQRLRARKEGTATDTQQGGLLTTPGLVGLVYGMRALRSAAARFHTHAWLWCTMASGAQWRAVHEMKQLSVN